MANLDTAAKRYSGIFVSCPWRGPAALPTGTVNRQATAYLYSGIAAAAPTPPVTTGRRRGGGFGRMGAGFGGLGVRGGPSGGGSSAPSLISGNVIFNLMGDSLTAARYTDADTSVGADGGTFRNAANSSVHNWAICRYGQPWSYTRDFGVGGETSADMLLRMSPALAVAAATAGSGNIPLASLWIGVNDIGNLGLDNAATIAGRVQNIGEQYEGVGSRAVYGQVVGSELWGSSDVQRTIDVNANMQTYIASHNPAVGRPLYARYGDKVWHNAPDATQTDTNIAVAQTPSAGVPMTLTGTTFSGGRKIRFILAANEAANRAMSIVGSYLGQAVSETATIPAGKKLWVSTNVYDTITSVTPATTFATTLSLGWTGITQKQGDTYDGLHQSMSGAYKLSQALYEPVAAIYALPPVTRVGTNVLLNPNFTALTGGTGGTGVTVGNVASGSSNVPANFQVVNTDTSNITTADFYFSPNSAKVTFVAGSSTTGGIQLKQNPSTALFTPGDSWNFWSDIVVGNGVANLKDAYAQLTLAYANTGALAISTLTWAANAAPFNGGLATGTTAAPHGLTVGEVWPAVVAGVSPSGYNTVTTQVKITGPSTFQYYVVASLADGTGGTVSLGGSIIYYADKTVATAGGVLPTSAQDQTFSYRFPNVPIMHGIALNSVNYITAFDLAGASSGFVTFKNLHIGKESP